MPPLGSAALSRVLACLRDDGQARYAPPVLIVERFVVHERFHGLVQRASRWSKRNAERANKIPVVRGLIARSSAVVALLTRRAPAIFPSAMAGRQQ